MNVLTFFQTLGARLSDLLYPPHCALCGMRTVAMPVCPRCASELIPDMLPRAIGEDSLSSFIPAFEFCDNTRELIHLLKYADRRDIGGYFGGVIAGKIDRYLFEGIDAVVPVPLHPVKERSRGYNQSRIVAQRLCSELGLRVDSSSIRRIKNTNTQTKLDAKERKTNVSGAFRSMKDLTGKRVVIVDDVITTGATSCEVARAISEAGGEVAFAIAIASPSLEKSQKHEI